MEKSGRQTKEEMVAIGNRKVVDSNRLSMFDEFIDLTGFCVQKSVN